MALLAPAVGGAAEAQTFSGPTPYLSRNDSPFLSGILDGSITLETFESGTLAAPGVTASAGAVLGPGPQTDSVDADDGVIDGFGTAGHSFYVNPGGAVTFTFSVAALGHWPRQAGIVWTDGAGTATFEAFGPTGASLGRIGPVPVGDNSFAGTTAEDRFFGVTYDGGISAIRISNTATGLEVDHLQYGGVAHPVPALPRPGLAALALALALVGWRHAVRTRRG